MKRIITFTLLFVFVLPCSLFAQESITSDWEFIPSLVLVTHFPGKQIKVEEYYGTSTYEYSGLGLNFYMRAFKQKLQPFVLTMSGGVNWFEAPQSVGYGVPRPLGVNDQGIGITLKRKDFRNFPFAVGVEAILPDSKNHSMMLYVGGNFSMNFIDGDVDIGQQIKLGYSIGGGFIVQILEFGVRYYSFSDIKNLGAHVGLRFNSFMIK